MKNTQPDVATSRGLTVAQMPSALAGAGSDELTRNYKCLARLVEEKSTSLDDLPDFISE